ncbi:MAG: hypothetical protein Q8N77_06580 [Nanoarchaeota archaeon]|nr:hypothetical protein [Nanoarchaeota archaeon]
MEQEKAVRLLTKKLVEASGRAVVFDKSHKDRLIGNANLAYVAGESKIVDYEKYGKKYFSQGEYEKKEYSGKSIEDVLKGIVSDEANYLFASKPISWGEHHLGINVVPYAILGSEERVAIRERFYKCSDVAVREAIGSLKIENFLEIYNIYSTKQFLALYKAIDRILQNPEFLSHFVQNPIEHRHIRVKGFTKENHDFDLLNSLLKRLDIKCGAFSDGMDVCTEYTSMLMKGLSNHSDFFRFVFSLPPEEQDVETNKLLLKMHPSLLDVDTTLLKEYSQGKFFKEYFEVLDGYQKENVLNLLKDCPSRNPEYDSFLFSLGFKDVMNLSDYRLWYETDSKRFIDSFQKEGREKKFAILKDLFVSEAMNQEVCNWLNKNEQDLLREVGFNS